MKNVSDFLPTVTEKFTDKSGRVLQLQVDIDFKKDKINRILFSEGFDQKSESDIEILENAIQNITPTDSLERIQSLNLNASPAFQLYLKFIQEYLGVVKVAQQSNLICPCRNFSKADLESFFQNNGFKTLAEFNSETMVGIDCHSCNQLLKDSYVDLINNKYQDKIPNKTIDETGNWLSFQGMSYGEVLAKIDTLLIEFIKDNHLNREDFVIVDSEGFKFFYKENSKVTDLILKQFQKLTFSRLGLLISLDRAL